MIAEDDPAADTIPTDPRSEEADETPVAKPCHASPEQWEAIGRKALADLLVRVRDDLDREIEEAITAARHDGAVTTDHVTHLRHSIADVERVVETMLVPLVDEAEPWEGIVDRVPYGQIANSLDLEFEAFRELLAERDGEGR